MKTLKTFIEAHGSQENAAKALDLSQGFLCRVLQGKRSLSLSQALRIETEHEISVTDFVSPEAKAFLNKPRTTQGEVSA